MLPEILFGECVPELDDVVVVIGQAYPSRRPGRPLPVQVLAGKASTAEDAAEIMSPLCMGMPFSTDRHMGFPSLVNHAHLTDSRADSAAVARRFLQHGVRCESGIRYHGVKRTRSRTAGS